MPRYPSRVRLLALALIALNFLLPALAMALPPGAPLLSVTERPEATSGFFSQLRDLFSVLWPENGSILEPNGTPRPSFGLPTKPNTASSDDNGSGLDPNG